MVQDFVKFCDKENKEEIFGILLADGSLICLCCGGNIAAEEIGDSEEKQFSIIERYGIGNITNINALLKKYW